MWSLFSRDPTKDFAYEITDESSDNGGTATCSVWKLHSGKRKSNGEAVSIFTFDVKNSNDAELQLAKASFKRMKTLRHPNLLSFLDGIETDKVLYIATEAVVPLATYIQDTTNQNSLQHHMTVSWGIHQVTKGLSFLINDCNLIHNNVCLSSVYVDRAGEWRVGGLEYLYPASGPESYPPVKLFPDLNKYDPPERTDGTKTKKPTEIWSLDMWGLGCLIWEVFNGSLPRTGSLKVIGKIPKPLVPHYCALVGANPKSRPNPADFLRLCLSSTSFMDNNFVKVNLFLEEIQIKDASEKTKFFNNLPKMLDSFPEAFCKHRILPQLVNAFEFGNAGSAVLAPLFKVGKFLDSDEYQRTIVPCVVKLFSSTDRATRVKLFQQMEHFVEHLQAPVINDKIFPNIVPGFLDSNPVIREQTIKSMLHLASKLNYKNLNEEVLKHFARLQSKDDQGGIRTNTTVCLGKIACYLHPQTRQKVLSSAYLRALKDPFPPSRQAGILAMAATHSYFTLQESCTRLIPALSVLTMDPDKQVRDHSFRAIKCFLGKLEKVSETPELLEDLEKDVSSGNTSAGGATGWAGWAVTGMGSLTSRLVKGRGQGQGSQSLAAAPSSQTASSDAPTNTTLEHTPSSAPCRTKPTVDEPITDKVIEESTNQEEGWSEEGWEEDDWGDMEDSKSDSNKPRIDQSEQGWNNTEGDGWDEDWKGIEEPEENLAVIRDDSSPWGASDFSPVSQSNPSSTYDWGDTGKDEFFFSMLDKKSGNKPASKVTNKPPSQNAPTKATPPQTTASQSEGWDDDWGSENAQHESKADEAKRKREERRAQRQKELQEKRATKSAAGAMKLGATKLNKI